MPAATTPAATASRATGAPSAHPSRRAWQAGGAGRGARHVTAFARVSSYKVSGARAAPLGHATVLAGGQGAVLGEDPRGEAWISMLLRTGRKLRPVQLVHRGPRQPEGKFLREPFLVSLGTDPRLNRLRLGQRSRQPTDLPRNLASRDRLLANTCSQDRLLHHENRSAVTLGSRTQMRPSVARQTGAWENGIYFYSHEPNEPPHVHVDRDDASAKFWLESVALARNLGFRPVELRRIARLVSEHEQELLEAWNANFPG